MENFEFNKAQKNKISQDELLKVSKKIMVDLFPQKNIQNDLRITDTLDNDLFLDSLARMEFLSRIESFFKVKFSERDLVEIGTLKDVLYKLLKTKGYTDTVIRKEIEIIEKSNSVFPPLSVKTLVELLEWHVQHHPNQIHAEFYCDSETNQTITYKELMTGSQAIAGGLSALNVSKSDKVILMLPSGLEYLTSFFGVLLVGAIPVPIYPLARPQQLEDHIRRHQVILKNCKAKVIIAPGEVSAIAHLLKFQVPSLRYIVSVSDLNKNKNIYIEEEISPTQLALIQYTSGSTGAPKGVMLTHENLLSNIRAIGESINVNSKDTVVSWLPLYHDMGLIGAWLGSLYYSVRLILISPIEFLNRPERWFWAIHRHRATISAAPNFAFELCLNRIKDEDLVGLDLSCLRVLMNGAEKVSPSTIEGFIAKFKEFKFNGRALLPVYGLAESSVGLCFSPLNLGPSVQYINRKIFMEQGIVQRVPKSFIDTISFVGCGNAIPGHQIRIVDSFGHEVSENQEGEIQFCGPSSTSGYYDNIEATKKLFEGIWLRTGDRGYLSNGELFITGREKDIIIRAGRHIYPEELENAIGDIKGVRRGRVVVFGVYDATVGTERLIVVTEIIKDQQIRHEEIKNLISKIVLDLSGAPPEEVVFAIPGSILKTSSGKLRRSATKDLYEQGKLQRPQRSLWRQIAVLIGEGILLRAQIIVRNIGTTIYAGYCWLVFLFLSITVFFLVLFVPFMRWRWSIVKSLIKFFFYVIGIKIHISYPSNKNDTHNAEVFVSNHASYLDSLVLMLVLPNSTCFVAKDELSKNFLLSVALRRMGAQFVERFELEKSLRDAEKLESVLNQNKKLIFFPEGTFIRQPGLLPFHSGAFILAAKKNVPLIPICIKGTREILRSDSWYPRHGAIYIFQGESIRTYQIPLEFSQDLWRKADYLREYAQKFIQINCGE